MLVINSKTEEALCIHAENAYPEECCGILLGKREGTKRIACKAVKTENAGGVKQTHFYIAPLEIAKIELSAEREQLEIVGFYHSHPNYEATASREDSLYMISGYSYPIISIKNGVCTQISCFEKSAPESTEVKEEKIIKQGEPSNADPCIYFSHTQNLCEQKSEG